MKFIPLEEVENFFWNKTLKSRGDDTVMYINLKDEILNLPNIDPIATIDEMIEEYNNGISCYDHEEYSKNGSISALQALKSRLSPNL